MLQGHNTYNLLPLLMLILRYRRPYTTMVTNEGPKIQLPKYNLGSNSSYNNDLRQVA